MTARRLVVVLVAASTVLWQAGSGGLGVAALPEPMVIDVVRIGGLLACAYLSLLLAVALVISGRRALPTWLDRLPLGRVVHHLAIGAAATMAVTAPVSASAATTPPAAVTLVRERPAQPEVEVDIQIEVEVEGPSYTVVPGDHLWSITERWLTLLHGERPSDAEIAPLWLAIIDRNSTAMADPDVIEPGQVIKLVWPT
jgi:nucleoid-associated protein YgaU